MKRKNSSVLVSVGMMFTIIGVTLSDTNSFLGSALMLVAIAICAIALRISIKEKKKERGS